MLGFKKAEADLRLDLLANAAVVQRSGIRQEHAIVDRISAGRPRMA